MPILSSLINTVPLIFFQSHMLIFSFAFRISPRSSAVFPNPEKPEGEDEDVQTERRRTADAVATPDAEEVEP